MTSASLLRRLPPEHERLWRQAAPDACWVLAELQRQGVTPNQILIVVAPAGSQAGEVLEEDATGWLVAGPCEASPTTPVAAVLVGDAMVEFVEGHEEAADYMADLPDDLCGLLVCGSDGPVISACQMPAAGEAAADFRGNVVWATGDPC